MTEPDHTTRRGMLANLGGAGLGLAGATLLGCGTDETQQADAATPSCTLVREQTEGPYYVDLNQIRRNVTEGKAGLRLDLRIKIVSADTCKVMKRAAVEIWHCDAAGKYSGIASEGTSGKTFLRGIQRTDENGVAVFRTIYPGWYRGRTPHIHLKVHVGGDEVHTGQLFFRDAVSAAIYTTRHYRARGTAETTNAEDGIYVASSRLAVKRRRGGGFIGRMTLNVEA